LEEFIPMCSVFFSEEGSESILFQSKIIRTRGGDRSDRPRSEFSTSILLIKGLSPAKMNENDIRNLFSGSTLVQDGIRIVKDSNSKPVAVFVEFTTNQDAGRALRTSRINKDPEDTPINVRPSSTTERDSFIAEARNPTPVVVVRRIPYSATEEEIKGIFGGFTINSIVVGNSVAFIKFGSAEEAVKALEKNGSEYAKRQIVIESAFDTDLKYAESRPIRTIRIRGAPATASEDDFRKFFEGLDILTVHITQREGISGRQVPGDVFIDFSTHEEFQKALTRDRLNMGDRYLQIFRSSVRERRNRMENPIRGSGGPGGSSRPALGGEGREGRSFGQPQSSYGSGNTSTFSFGKS